jgi:hypothetical protein
MATWVTKDNRRIKVSEMEDRHLRNTLAFMERKLDDLMNEQAAAYAYDGGEMATYYATQAAEEMGEPIADARYWIEVFETEIKRRKL